MVIDAAKGIEARTRKLFEICRLRDIPIVTFINKMDREARDPFELLDEVASTLALDTAPVTWPVGRAATFAGTYDLRNRDLHLTTPLPQSEPRLIALDEEVDLVRAALPEFDRESFNAGHLTPVYFGSAIKGIGVTDLLDGLAEYGPPPRAQKADTRMIDASEPSLTALVFKIQANMDPNHRDRIAFARVCSGRLTRGMRLKQVRTGKLIPLHAPQFFFAREREIADEAFAGDVVGIPNHGTLRIGDTLTDGEDVNFVGVPYFAPEILRRVRLDDAMKAKKLRQALVELAEEGVVQLFRPQDGAAALVGVVGTLQLDVLQSRLMGEYGVKIGFEATPHALARWVSSADKAALARFIAANRSSMADDVDGDPVFLASSAFMMRRAEELAPEIRVPRREGRPRGEAGGLTQSASAALAGETPIGPRCGSTAQLDATLGRCAVSSVHRQIDAPGVLVATSAPPLRRWRRGAALDGQTAPGIHALSSRRGIVVDAAPPSA